MSLEFNLSIGSELKDIIWTKYIVSGIKDSSYMPYVSKSGDAISICINPNYIMENINILKKVIKNQNEVKMIDGSTGNEFEREITIGKISLCKNQ